MAKFLCQLMGDAADALIESIQGMTKAQLRAELDSGGTSEARMCELFDFADKATKDAVLSMPADLSSFDRPTLLDSSASLPFLSEDQLRSLTATQVQWLNVSTLTTIAEKLQIPKDGSKLKSELVQKLLKHLHGSSSTGTSTSTTAVGGEMADAGTTGGEGGEVTGVGPDGQRSTEGALEQIQGSVHVGQILEETTERWEQGKNLLCFLLNIVCYFQVDIALMLLWFSFMCFERGHWCVFFLQWQQGKHWWGQLLLGVAPTRGTSWRS